MRNRMVKAGRSCLTVLVLLFMMGALCACNSVAVSGDLTINFDGSGTRIIKGDIDKAGYDSTYGIAYYYLKLHGEDLKNWFSETYTEKVPGSEEWLNIEVVDGGASEVVTISFDFTSFEEYEARLQALSFNEEDAASYQAPEITVVDGKITAYSESTGVMTAIMNSIHNEVINDDTLYDDACTDADGNSLNGGSANGAQDSSGVALIGTGTGPLLTIQIDGDKVISLFDEEGVGFVSYTVPEDAAEEDTSQAAVDATEEIPAETESDLAEEESSQSVDETEKGEDGKTSDGSMIAVIVAAAVVLILIIVAFVAAKKKKVVK